MSKNVTQIYPFPLSTFVCILAYTPSVEISFMYDPIHVHQILSFKIH